MKGYGTEVILDIQDCNPEKFTRKSIKKYCKKLCKLIDMKREDLHFWDYKGNMKEYLLAPDHLKGTSAVQFLRTSNITIHTLDVLKSAYINVFSCKDFDKDIVIKFSEEWFEGKTMEVNTLTRGRVKYK